MTILTHDNITILDTPIPFSNMNIDVMKISYCEEDGNNTDLYFGLYLYKYSDKADIFFGISTDLDGRNILVRSNSIYELVNEHNHYFNAKLLRTMYYSTLELIYFNLKIIIPEKDAYEYIDTIINDITAPFAPVMEVLGVKTLEEGKTRNGISRKTNSITNIIKF